MVSIIISSLFVIVCFLLLLVVLLQQGRGGDIAAAFGGSSSQAAFGARAGATILTRATTVLGTLFMLCALVLAILGQRGPGSVVGGVGAPPAEAPAQGEPAAPSAPTPESQAAPPAEQPAPPAAPPR